MATRLGWGFVGVSTIARQHMHAAVSADDRCAVTAVMSRSAERAQAFAAEYGVPAAYTDVDQLLGDPDVDVVYISTTNEQHAEQTLAAAAAGKHVLCEKPLALTVADAIAMRDACAKAGVTMGTNHHLRHADTLREMGRLVAGGAIGTPLAARVFHAVQLPEELRTWRVNRRDGGGVALDITVHDCDTLRFLLGAEVLDVTAIAANQGLADDGIPDALMGVMRFEHDLLASFHDAFTVPHAGTGLELHGTEGSLIGEGVMTQQPVGQVYLRWGAERRLIDIGPRGSLYARGVRQYVDAVVSGGVPAAGADDGIVSLTVALAAVESARTGRTVHVDRPAASGS